MKLNTSKLRNYTPYKGWHVTNTGFGSQGWRATRSGVEMCANTPEALQGMIDRKVLEDDE